MTGWTLHDCDPWFEVRILLISFRIRQHTPGHAEVDAGYCIDRACDFQWVINAKLAPAPQEQR